MCPFPNEGEIGDTHLFMAYNEIEVKMKKILTTDEV